MNKIASIEKITDVIPHPNADRLDIVYILGFQCVSQRGLHTKGDEVVYIQPDSLLPELSWTVEYRKYSPSRIKAVKLRGEWSEGIIVKFEQLPDEIVDRHLMYAEVGADVSEFLGITHWEPPLPKDNSAKGLLPLGIPKTDEERWENMVQRLPIGHVVDVTLKVDGQSWSAFYDVKTKTFGVCGRTMEYKMIEGLTNNYVDQLARYGIQKKLTDYCELHGVSLCIRGESYGQGIQAIGYNPHARLKKGLAIFGVWLIDDRRRAGKGDTFYFKNVCKDLDLPMVDMIEENVVLTMDLIKRYSTGITKLNNREFEGVVINHGVYDLTQASRSYTNPAGEEIQIDPFVKTFQAGSFKVINKSYDSNK